MPRLHSGLEWWLVLISVVWKKAQRWVFPALCFKFRKKKTTCSIYEMDKFKLAFRHLLAPLSPLRLYFIYHLSYIFWEYKLYLAINKIKADERPDESSLFFYSKPEFGQKSFWKVGRRLNDSMTCVRLMTMAFKEGWRTNTWDFHRFLETIIGTDMHIGNYF